MLKSAIPSGERCHVHLYFCRQCGGRLSNAEAEAIRPDEDTANIVCGNCIKLSAPPVATAVPSPPVTVTAPRATAIRSRESGLRAATMTATPARGMRATSTARQAANSPPTPAKRLTVPAIAGGAIALLTLVAGIYFATGSSEKKVAESSETPKSPPAAPAPLPMAAPAEKEKLENKWSATAARPAVTNDADARQIPNAVESTPAAPASPVEETPKEAYDRKKESRVDQGYRHAGGRNAATRLSRLPATSPVYDPNDPEWKLLTKDLNGWVSWKGHFTIQDGAFVSNGETSSIQTTDSYGDFDFSCKIYLSGKTHYCEVFVHDLSFNYGIGWPEMNVWRDVRISIRGTTARATLDGAPMAPLASTPQASGFLGFYVPKNGVLKVKDAAIRVVKK